MMDLFEPKDADECYATGSQTTVVSLSVKNGGACEAQEMRVSSHRAILIKHYAFSSTPTISFDAQEINVRKLNMEVSCLVLTKNRSFLLIARLCTCFKFTDVPPAVDVGVPANATWSRDPLDFFTQINLVQDDRNEFLQQVSDAPELRKLSGLVTFTIPKPGTFRLEGVRTNFGKKINLRPSSGKIKAESEVHLRHLHQTLRCRKGESYLYAAIRILTASKHIVIDLVIYIGVDVDISIDIDLESDLHRKPSFVQASIRLARLIHVSLWSSL
ncbi:hypothetical protein AAF712_010287 [Marasmius tenuissimus]|uniref:Uncharacterized protein n=1 Tax=Marasmius tenuissimus TaxID=585030 RepID=A0ABR2ZR23_9AGAR